MPSLLCSNNLQCLQNAAQRGVFDVEIIAQRPGFLAFSVQDKDDLAAWETFKHEPGGHRWQRIPPNERSGRVHTSTVTCAVLLEPPKQLLVIRDQDLDWKFSRGSGAGGQARNKLETAVDLTYKPTGLTVHCETERSQTQNKLNAMSLLRAKLWEQQQTQQHNSRNQQRKQHVGAGARGDKTWTIRMQDDQVTFHGNETTQTQKFRLKDYLAGQYEVK